MKALIYPDNGKFTGFVPEFWGNFGPPIGIFSQTSGPALLVNFG
jgi:hypothetical protein